MERTLKIVMSLQNGKTFTINVIDAKENITYEQVTDPESGLAGYIVAENMVIQDGIEVGDVKEVYYENVETQILV